MTPKHLALVAKVPTAALPLLRKLRDSDEPRRLLVEKQQARFAKLGLTLTVGSGIDKTFIAFGDGYVVKIGHGTTREAKLSADGKRRCLALTAMLDDGIAVQERADTVIGNTEIFKQHVYEEARAQLAPIYKRQWSRIEQVCRVLGINDTHAWNIGVFANGRLKIIDFAY